MSNQHTRRTFLNTAAVGGAALGLPPLDAFRSLAHAVEDPKKAPDIIRFGADIEPIVRLIEETPREKCVAVMVEQLRGGLPYRRFFSAIFLAAIRKQNPHHVIYQMNSAHQVSLDVRAEERFLPLFWAMDGFKRQQENFPSPPIERLTGTLPTADKAATEFHDAMQRSDGERAARAAVALARSDGARQAFDLFWHYGCRDVSLIGHRAISVTSCWRALETIGWQYAEPVLRFVVWDLHSRGGGTDGFFRPNLARVEKVHSKLPAGWAVGKADKAATLELFALLRQGQSENACELAVKQLAGDFGAQPLWDAIHIAAAELLMLHTASNGMNGRPLHVNTTANALHFAFNTSTSSRTRLLILLQACAWIADFLRVHLGEKGLNDNKPIALDVAKPPASAAEAVEEIFALLPPRTYQSGGGWVHAKRGDRVELGQKTFALLHQHPDSSTLFMRAARSWLCVKSGNDAHEYKLPAAMFEDLESISPEWRPRLLAASVHWLHGKQSPDSPVALQAREALCKIG